MFDFGFVINVWCYKFNICVEYLVNVIFDLFILYCSFGMIMIDFGCDRGYSYFEEIGVKFLFIDNGFFKIFYCMDYSELF